MRRLEGYISLAVATALALNACTPRNGGEVTPTPTEKPPATALIDPEPAGYDLTPGPTEIISTPSAMAPESTMTPDVQASGDIFVQPTAEDAKNHFGTAEVEPPESIKEEVAGIKAAMTKILPSVAEICAVPEDSLKPVFKEGSVDDQYRWTVVYEGEYEGEIVTCWSSVASNGRLGEFPTYFDSNGQVKSEKQGISWERVTGAFDWAGTVPVLLSKDAYIVPEGLTGSDINTPDNWTRYTAASGEGEVMPVSNPISREDMQILTAAGYSWDVKTGTLKDEKGSIFLTFKDETFLDQDGVAFEVDAYNPIKVNGVDPEGNPVLVVHERTIQGEEGKTHTELYVEKTGEWRSTEGYEPGSTSETDVMKWKPVTQEDVESGFLRTLKLSQQYKWPQNTVTPKWYVNFMGGSKTGAMELTIFKDNRDEYDGEGAVPDVPLDMYRIQSPNDPNLWLPLGVSLFKSPNGADMVYTEAFGSKYATYITGDGTTFLHSSFGAGNRDLTFVVGMDNHSCENASLRGGEDSSWIEDSCAFWPTNDPRWDRVSWETILNGEPFGSRYESDPLTEEFVIQYQDEVMMAYHD